MLTPEELRAAVAIVHEPGEEYPTLLVPKEVLARYNMVSFGKERIILAGDENMTSEELAAIKAYHLEQIDLERKAYEALPSPPEAEMTQDFVGRLVAEHLMVDGPLACGCTKTGIVSLKSY